MRAGCSVAAGERSGTVADMLPLLLLAPMTVRQICERLGRNRETVRSALNKAKAQNRIHIQYWARNRGFPGAAVPHYIWGSGEDAPKPRALTPQEKGKRWRRSKVGREWLERYSENRSLKRRFESSGVRAIDPLLAAIMGV